MTRNSKLFSDCLRHPEPLVDPFYCSEELVIPASPEHDDTATVTLWRDVRDRLIAADVALRDDNKTSYRHHIGKLDELLQRRNANFLELTSFFPALDVSYSNYRKLGEAPRRQFLTHAVHEYLVKRHPIYMAHGYTPVTVQVRRDFEKHKSGGSAATRKLDALLAEYNYRKAGTLAEFQESSPVYVHASSALYGQCEAWLRMLGLQFPWRANHQNKLPDVLIRRDTKILIVECKHMKETGGGQDKQVAELISLVGQQETHFHSSDGITVSYVAFLDGVLFNEFVAPVAAKQRRQKQDIEASLARNPSNQFVNTWGFRQLLG